jgi:hypothetical protein
LWEQKKAMKTKQYKQGAFSHLSQEEYYSKYSELNSQCSDVSCFAFQGRYFAGCSTQTIKQYLLESPSKSFLVWLIDNELEVTQQ